MGELLPVSPVLVFDPSRQLLTTYSGAWLESKEIKDTKLTLAYIDGINNRYDNQFRDLTKCSLQVKDSDGTRELLGPTRMVCILRVLIINLHLRLVVAIGMPMFKTFTHSNMLGANYKPS